MSQRAKQPGSAAPLLILVLALIAAALVAGIRFSNRPVILNAEDLTPADHMEELYPYALLDLECSDRRELTATLRNEGTLPLTHGDPPALSLDVLLDSSWYCVPCKPWSRTEPNHVTQPGDAWSFTPYLEPYGNLPDGAYRISFLCQNIPEGWDRPYDELPSWRVQSFFSILNGQILPAVRAEDPGSGDPDLLMNAVLKEDSLQITLTNHSDVPVSHDPPQFATLLMAQEDGIYQVLMEDFPGDPADALPLEPGQSCTGSLSLVHLYGDPLPDGTYCLALPFCSTGSELRTAVFWFVIVDGTMAQESFA